MNVLAIIPARYNSSRFPGKPLALLGGQSVISRVFLSVNTSPIVNKTIVATDDDRIFAHINDIAGPGHAVLTSPDLPSGTDRCREALRSSENTGFLPEVVLNIQGDEPFISHSQIQTLLDCFVDPNTQIATLCTPIHSTDQLLSPDNVKVIRDSHNFAIYFSRHPIPFQRGVSPDQWLDGDTPYFKHLGIYAFRTDILKQVCSLPQSSLEKAEKLEQLRWLQNGFRIAVALSDHDNIGIDTPADLAAAQQFLNQHSGFSA